MIVFRQIDLKTPELQRGIALTIGVFDGLHIGHQAVIQQLLQRSEISKLPSAVLTFDPTPMEFLKTEQSKPFLTTFDQKVKLLKKLKIDLLFALPFAKELSRMSPTQFIDDILLDRLNAKEIIVGYDWKFGREQSGNVELLKSHSIDRKFQATIVKPEPFESLAVHSTRIRRAINDGKLALAEKLLGRRYAISGKVTSGDGRGKSIGFPTANVELGKQLSPPNGVYSVRLKLDDESFDGVLNVGIRPTFESDSGEISKGTIDKSIEVHIFEFDQDIYGKNVEIVLLEKIRNEIKFPNSESLSHQIAKDIERAKQIIRDSL